MLLTVITRPYPTKKDGRDLNKKVVHNNLSYSMLTNNRENVTSRRVKLNYL